MCIIPNDTIVTLNYVFLLFHLIGVFMSNWNCTDIVVYHFPRDREERHKIQDIRPAFQRNPRFTRCAVCSLLSWNGEPYREQFPR